MSKRVIIKMETTGLKVISLTTPNRMLWCVPRVADDSIHHWPCVLYNTGSNVFLNTDCAHFGGCIAGPASLLHQAWAGSMRGEGRCRRRGGNEDQSAGAECGSTLWRNT